MDDFKYLKIVDWAKGYIKDNSLAAGDRFLTEMQLCELHGVSRQTVRQALMKLENDGVITRVRGSGTYVADGFAPLPIRSGLPGTVGVISTYFSDYIFPHIVTGIEGVLGARGCTMQLAITHDRVAEERQALESMLANGVDGLIIEPSKSALPNPNADIYARVRREGLPVLFFNAKYPWSELPCVAMDDAAAGRIAADHLFERGHGQIFGLFALDDIQGHLRYKGFMESCLAHGVTDCEDRVFWFAGAERGEVLGYAGEHILGRMKGCTGVVCYNDKLALELMKLFRAHGVRVPEDISVVSIDDSSYAAVCEVPLTSVRHPQKQLGEAAAEALLGMITNGTAPSEDRLFTPSLTVRDSVKRIK